MGFDAGILTDESKPVWDFKPGYVDWLDRWKQPHNPKLWLANSCVWYSQIITRKLGMPRFTEYTQRLNYGNQDTSGDKGMNNGLTNCWLSSSLAISAEEQMSFIEKLIHNQLPISIQAHEMTKRIMFVEAVDNGWKLYSKTGRGLQLDANGHKIQDRQIGWFVGFAMKDDDVVSFVYLILDDDKQARYASVRAKAALKQKLYTILR